MDVTMFEKMKVKPESTGCVINTPDDYPIEASGIHFDWDSSSFDFVHLFVRSREQFDELLDTAAGRCKLGALLWVSYPKGSGKTKYDINRDSLWDLSIKHDYHPVAQISLDSTWSAVRLIINEEGVSYSRPKQIDK